MEQIGVSRAKKAAEEADLIIYVVDGACPLDENDQNIIEMIRDRRAVVLLNKSDLELVIKAEYLEKKTGHPVISISIKEEIGLEKLEKVVSEMFFHGKIGLNDEIVITNVRHKIALKETFESLDMVMKGIEDRVSEDFLTIDLMDAYGKLGSIIGESVEEDLINEIFGKFCMGK